MPQRNNDTVGTTYSHIFMKKGDAISPHIVTGSFSSPPTDAELDAAFGATAAEINTVSDPFLAVIVNTAIGTVVRLAVATSNGWYFSAPLTLAT